MRGTRRKKSEARAFGREFQRNAEGLKFMFVGTMDTVFVLRKIVGIKEPRSTQMTCMVLYSIVPITMFTKNAL